MTGSRAPLVGMSLGEMESLLKDHGEPSFRARQLYRWTYARRARDFREMTNLPGQLRDRLAESHHLERPLLEKVESSSDGTRKFLYRLEGGPAESVLMPEPRRDTFCISSQAGCALDCRFCLTALMGFGRHLSPGEIVGQALTMLDELTVGERPVNVVFMGMGEPLHNYDSVLAAFRLLADPEGIGIPARRITLSTAGMVPGIRRLAGEKIRPRLAISLNATEDETRSRIMPINRKHPIQELLEAAAALPLGPRERVTFEYVMLKGINSRLEDARRLLRLVRRHKLRAKVNLIPFNPGGGLEFQAPPRDEILAFRDLLLAAGLPCSVRRNRGRDISAACGQLAVLEERERLRRRSPPERGAASEGAGGALEAAPETGRPATMRRRRG